MPPRVLPLVLGLLVCGPSALAQVSALEPVELDPLALRALVLRCKTPAYERLGPDSTSDCSYNATTIQGQHDPTYVLDIPVVFHVIQNTSGTGNITNAKVMSQIDVLNEDFRALAGSNGAGGFDTLIQFHLATLDPLGMPTNGITRTTDTTWYNDVGPYYDTLAWDPERFLNIYSNSGGGALGYVPDLPQAGGLVGTNEDRVVLYWGVVGKNAVLAPYDQGRTATHEVGHYLGLFHTFDFGCGTSSPPDCYTTGDRICDTNPAPVSRLGCPMSSGCGLPEPVDNYLSYTDDLCMTHFTAEQSNRMRCTLVYWRPLLVAACGGLAGSTLRNSGANPLSYSANAPLIGGTLTLAVDLSITGHTQALVMGFNSPLDIGLGAGQRLLVNVADVAGELLGLPLQAGPLATWNLPVMPFGCGLELYTQAIQLGGVFPFALSNARDLTIGL